MPLIYYPYAWWLDNVYTKFINSDKKRKGLSVSYEHGLHICFMLRNNFLCIITLPGRMAHTHWINFWVLQKEKCYHEEKCILFESVISRHKKNHYPFKTF